MTTVKVRAEIESDGRLRLEVPVDLPAGSAEVLIVVQPVGSNDRGTTSQVGITARSGLFMGSMDHNLDVDAVLNEMNQAWKSKLTNPL